MTCHPSEGVLDSMGGDIFTKHLGVTFLLTEVVK